MKVTPGGVVRRSASCSLRRCCSPRIRRRRKLPRRTAASVVSVDLSTGVGWPLPAAGAPVVVNVRVRDATTCTFLAQRRTFSSLYPVKTVGCASGRATWTVPAIANSHRSDVHLTYGVRVRGADGRAVRRTVTVTQRAPRPQPSRPARHGRAPTGRATSCLRRRRSPRSAASGPCPRSTARRPPTAVSRSGSGSAGPPLATRRCVRKPPADGDHRGLHRRRAAEPGLVGAVPERAEPLGGFRGLPDRVGRPGPGVGLRRPDRCLGDESGRPHNRGVGRDDDRERVGRPHGRRRRHLRSSGPHNEPLILGRLHRRVDRRGLRRAGLPRPCLPPRTARSTSAASRRAWRHGA